MALPKNVHRVEKKLSGGRFRYYFYIRGGGKPSFWKDDVREPTDPGFAHAYAAVTERPRPRELMVPELVDRFLDSAAMPKAERSRADIRKWVLRFAEEFRHAPAEIFEARGSRAEMNRWRGTWKEPPKQHDMAGTHATRVLNWAVQEGILAEHHCHRLPKLYEVDRSEIVWKPTDVAAILAIAPEWVQRILVTACATGLRPGDLVKLTMGQVERTPEGRRLRVRTAKGKRIAHIPILPELAEVIDETPRDRLLVLGNAHGNPLTPHRASEGLRQWRDKARLSSDLHLHDCRGTAATRLLNAGLSLAEIVDYMGWSPRYAAQMIETYARVSPSETDAVLAKLATARGRAK